MRDRSAELALSHPTHVRNIHDVEICLQTTPPVREEPRYRKERGACERADLRANHPSSSSLLDRAGSGAPGPSSFSTVGNLTYPSLLKGFNFCNVPYTPLGFVVLVLAVCSLLDQPKLFMLSLNEVDAMAESCVFCGDAKDAGLRFHL